MSRNCVVHYNEIDLASPTVRPLPENAFETLIANKSARERLAEIIYIKNRLATCLLRGMNHTDNIHSVIKNLQWLFRLKGIENETRIIQQQILKKEEPVEPAKVRSKYFRRCV